MDSNNSKEGGTGPKEQSNSGERGGRRRSRNRGGRGRGQGDAGPGLNERQEHRQANEVESKEGVGGRSRNRNRIEKRDRNQRNADQAEKVESSEPAESFEAHFIAPTTDCTSLLSLKIMPQILSAIADLGYTQPTPIQQLAIPPALEGKDVLAGARTGTGKTAAFAIPVLQRMYFDNPKNKSLKMECLTLTPTRELAAQVDESFRALGKNFPGFSTAVVFGGVPKEQQKQALGQNPVVLVATPGRLLDLYSEKNVNFDNIKFLVIDEADRMLDMGFFPDVSKILKLLPTNRQSLLFSATFPKEVENVARSTLKPPVARVQVTPPNTTGELIQQEYYLVARDKKMQALEHIIRSHSWSQVLVFTRTKHGANEVSRYLESCGITSMAMHGNKSQKARIEALGRFKNGTLTTLVATDVAARGIDIEELPHVVNYEIPNVPEDYIHRIGRTGRAGREGVAISLVSKDEERFMQDIIDRIKVQIPQNNKLPSEFVPPPHEKAEPIAIGRQVLWGGLNPRPPPNVMQAASKAAQRTIRENKRQRNDQRDSGAPRPPPRGEHVPKSPRGNNENGGGRGRRRGHRR